MKARVLFSGFGCSRRCQPRAEREPPPSRLPRRRHGAESLHQIQFRQPDRLRADPGDGPAHAYRRRQPLPAERLWCGPGLRRAQGLRLGMARSTGTSTRVATTNGSWRAGAYMKAYRLPGGPIRHAVPEHERNQAQDRAAVHQRTVAQLLLAVYLAESRRLLWPWAVHDAGRPHHLWLH